MPAAKASHFTVVNVMTARAATVTASPNKMALRSPIASVKEPAKTAHRVMAVDHPATIKPACWSL